MDEIIRPKVVYFKMPQADRKKKTSMKVLPEVVAQPGQSRITLIFAKTSSKEITNQITAHEKLEGGASETQLSEDCDIAIYETWVNPAEDYTSQDSESEKRKIISWRMVHKA